MDFEEKIEEVYLQSSAAISSQEAHQAYHGLP